MVSKISKGLTIQLDLFYSLITSSIQVERLLCCQHILFKEIYTRLQFLLKENIILLKMSKFQIYITGSYFAFSLFAFGPIYTV